MAKIDSVDIQPLKVTLTINTVPAGLTINVDGQPKTTPISFLAVAGVTRNLEAVSQTFNGQSYNFASWSDGGAANHNIATPGTSKTYTATFTTGGGAIALPGRVQAEDYKAGGEGAGYHDLTAGNTGGQYRTDNVDIEATADAGGGYNVGWIDANEWLAYDVNVAAAGTYTLSARVASGVAGAKTFAVSIDGGSPINFSFTDASGWQAWNNVEAAGVNLTAGAHVLRVLFTSGNMNMNYLDVSAGGSANILANGDFSNGLVSWNTYFSSPAAGTIANENGSARAAIANAGVNEYDIQLWQAAPLTAGHAYALDFDVKGEATPKNFKIVVEHNGSPWTKYVELAKTVTAAANAYQHYTVAWNQGVDDAGGRVVFDLGAQNESDLWVDNVVLK